MLKYKKDIIQELKRKGYNTTKILKENIISQSSMQKFRTGEVVSTLTINKLCELLKCQPADLIEYVPDEGEKEK